MKRVIIRVKDMNRISELEELGSIIYKSPILNIMALEVKDNRVDCIGNYDNVINYEIESEGNLMPTL